MNPCLRSMALVAALAVASTVLATPAPDSSVRGAVEQARPMLGLPGSVGHSGNVSLPGTAGEVQQTWICDRSDNICGLDDPRMLSKPAKVDYDALLKATAEMKKIVNDKIDPNSSEGINLRQRAVDRVREKSEAVRTAQGYCSVWKAIRHQDGRTIPDITDLVKAQL